MEWNGMERSEWRLLPWIVDTLSTVSDGAQRKNGPQEKLATRPSPMNKASAKLHIEKTSTAHLTWKVLRLFCTCQMTWGNVASGAGALRNSRARQNVVWHVI